MSVKTKMGRPVANLIGQTFGYLTVVKFVERRKNNPLWLCACACGGEKIVYAANLTSGRTKGCGSAGHTERIAKLLKVGRG